jgi:3-oxoacyl-[acyl-carrier-protein] synthase-3
VGSYQPERVVTNDEMCTMIDSSDEWIRQRTGIAERHWAGEDESLLTMMERASRRALEHAQVEASQIDTIVVSTVTWLKQTPAIAPLLGAALGCPTAAAYDISAACAGFEYALAQADGLVRAGAAGHVLIVAADKLTDLTDLTDRSTAFLFADGAGAAVVGPSDVPRIGPVVWGADGEQGDVITMSSDWLTAMRTGVPSTITMEGRKVFRWATTTIADVAQKVLDVSGVSADELDLFIPHQANNRITDSMLRHLTLPDSVLVARTIERTGNTSASSIPMAIDTLYHSGDIRPDATALLIGFGAGLVYAGQVVILP